MSLPELPTMSTPFRDKVFKDKSSSPVSSTAKGSGSGSVPSFEHLVLIGATVIQFGIMSWSIDYYSNNSMRDLTELGNLTNRKPSCWGKLYRLRSRCPASSVLYTETGLLSPLPSPSASRTVPRSNGELFRAYIGALFLENGGEKGGLSITNRWIRKILEYEVKQGTLEIASEDDESSGISLISPLPSPATSKPSRNIPITQATGTSVGPSSGDPVTNAITRLDNLGKKCRKEISWTHSSEGDSHTLDWTMEATIDGYGRKFKATAKNKTAAKTLAAESALGDKRLLSFLNAQST